jgi:ketosteroid isomerase-like protein
VTDHDWLVDRFETHRAHLQAVAYRMLGSRHKVQGSGPVADLDPTRQREVVNAFLAASRNGDFDALVALLDPDVVLRSDGGVQPPDASVVARGASAVAGRALVGAQASAVVRPALVNGAAGVVVTADGRPVSVMGFTVTNGKIVAIDVLADPERIRQLDLAALDD